MGTTRVAHDHEPRPHSYRRSRADAHALPPYVGPPVPYWAQTTPVLPKPIETRAKD